MKSIRSGIALLLCVGLAAPTLAQDQAQQDEQKEKKEKKEVDKGKLGETAPELHIAEWVKGDAIDLSKGKGENIYVVEFWATWCGPCRVSIPHLTELQKKHEKDNVIFIGVTDEQDNLKKVRDFVKDQGDKMAYHVAVDDEEKTNEAYMRRFNENGIPHAFIINKQNKIVWHGHPMGMDDVLQKVVDGKWDMAEAKRLEAQQEKAKQAMMKLNTEYFPKLFAEGNTKEVQKIGREILDLGGHDAMLMNGFAWFVLTDERIPNEHRDLELAMKAAAAAYKACDGKDAAIVDTYAAALWKTGKKQEALKQQRKAVQLAEDKDMKAELQKRLDEYQQELQQ